MGPTIDYPFPDWLPQDDYLRRLITGEHDEMLPYGAGTLTEVRAAHHLSKLARRAFEWGRHQAIAELKTSDDAAAELGITRARVLALARSRSVGWRIGRDVLFRPEDIAAMRERTPGRPRKV